MFDLLHYIVRSVCRYLDRYEKVHFLGEDGGRGSDDDDDSRHKRWSARALHSVPLTYNAYQHVLSGEWVRPARRTYEAWPVVTLSVRLSFHVPLNQELSLDVNAYKRCAANVFAQCPSLRGTCLRGRRRSYCIEMKVARCPHRQCSTRNLFWSTEVTEVESLLPASSLSR